MYCMECGAQNGDSDRFCQACGKPLRAPEPSPSVYASAPVSYPPSYPASYPVSPAPTPGPQPVPPPAAPAAPPPEAIIEIRCIAGPDIGKMYRIGSTQAALGRLSGLIDPGVADRHVTLCWAQDTLYFSAAPGFHLDVNGVALGDGRMGPSQQFRLGSSTWMVGTMPVRLDHVFQQAKDRLNRFAGVERLEGFSLSEMFSEVFKKRAPEEIENYFLVGTSQTTPALQEIVVAWPKPWFFMRVLMFIAALYLLLEFAAYQFGNPRVVPGMLIMGALAIPFATVILFFELNIRRNVSFYMVLMLVCLGGVLSIVIAIFGFRVTSLNSWLGASSAGIIEESAKLLTVALLVRNAKYKYILNGLLFGAAVGCGFAFYESAGYAFDQVGGIGWLDAVVHSIHMRGLLSPFGHVAWTAIAAGAFWRAKGDKGLSIEPLKSLVFWRTFSIPVVLHMLWNSPIPGTFYLKYLLIGLVGWFVIFGLVQEGLKQVRAEQLAVGGAAPVPIRGGAAQAV
jgi:protease PrsW